CPGIQRRPADHRRVLLLRTYASGARYPAFRQAGGGTPGRQLPHHHALARYRATFQSSLKVVLPSVLATSIFWKVKEMSSRDRGLGGSPESGKPMYRFTPEMVALVSRMVSKANCWPWALVLRNSNSTSVSTSLVPAAFMISGEVASHSLVITMGVYCLLPLAIPLEASRGEDTLIRNCVQGIHLSGRP